MPLTLRTLTIRDSARFLPRAAGALLGSALLLACISCEPRAVEWEAPWTPPSDVAGYQSVHEAQLAAARRNIGTLLSVEGKRTAANTLRPLDEAWLQLEQAGSAASLIENVYPQKPLREAASKAAQDVMALANEITLNPEIYRALAAIDPSGEDAVTKHYLAKTLREFRLQGVDKDAATREKLRSLRDELLKIEQEFQRNINADKSTVTVESRDELDGLPADLLASLKQDSRRRTILPTDAALVQPVLTYASNESLRKRMYLAWRNKAYPVNIPLLQSMLAKRQEIADLLGYTNWAAYIVADKMVGSAERANAFVDRMLVLSKERAAREATELLAAARKVQPGTQEIDEWSSSYYAEQVRRERFAFDSQEARAYFPYTSVKQGTFDVLGKLFGLEFRKVEGAPVWHPSVEVYELLDNGIAIGRFYLDMHPRADKFSHAAQFGLRSGIDRRRLPEAALVCNFAAPDGADPGLLTHADVETFFHEFGHLLHTLLAGRHDWVGVSGIKTEYDFVEAPSQLLEEWVRDAKILQSFARHHQTGAPIPSELVAKMKRADRFGRGLWASRQAMYAAISLRLHQQSAFPVDTDAVVKGILREGSPFPVPAEMHMEASFGHLTGYSAIYYTYLWSLTISKDLLNAFDANNLMNPKVARRYRDRVLAPGGAKPADELIRDFLGREFSIQPFERWLAEGDQAEPGVAE